MAGKGNPADPAQARMQASIHEQSGGAVAEPTRTRFKRHVLSVMTRFLNLSECCRIADRPNGNGAAKTFVAYLCLSNVATVDTTNQPYAIS